MSSIFVQVPFIDANNRDTSIKTSGIVEAKSTNRR